MKSNLLDLEMQLHIETDKAILVSDDGERKNAKWLPKSQVEVQYKPAKRIYIVTMPEWLAMENGWI